jgi:CO/xanthine dehydrogenase FAD-binding subunit
VTGFEYERPASLEEAFAILDEWGTEAHPLAGGTDLAVAIRHRGLQPGLVVDLKSIAEMTPEIEVSDGLVTIAANTAMRDLEEDRRIQTLFPGLIEAAEVVGSVQIRNRATLAGNACNASPAADTPPVLVALDASVTISGRDGSRRIPLDDFFIDYRQTALQQGELLTALHIPTPAARSGSAFLKLGVRRAMEISIVCVGSRIDLAEDGTIAAVGIGLGSVGPRTIRASLAEEMLVGNPPNPELFAAAGSRALEASSPIDDLRASAEYRRSMIPVLVRRALTAAAERAGRER